METKSKLPILAGRCGGIPCRLAVLSYAPRISVGSMIPRICGRVSVPIRRLHRRIGGYRKGILGRLASVPRVRICDIDEILS